MKLAFLFASLLFAQISFAATEGEFKMYPQPQFAPHAGCDYHTKLKVSEKNDEVTATLYDDIDSMCNTKIDPVVRTYTAKRVADDCGSHVFALFEARTGREIFKITDHATRLCRDLQPSRIEVVEINEKGVRTELYSER